MEKRKSDEAGTPRRRCPHSRKTSPYASEANINEALRNPTFSDLANGEIQDLLHPGMQSLLLFAPLMKLSLEERRSNDFYPFQSLWN